MNPLQSLQHARYGVALALSGSNQSLRPLNPSNAKLDPFLAIFVLVAAFPGAARCLKHSFKHSLAELKWHPIARHGKAGQALIEQEGGR